MKKKYEMGTYKNTEKYQRTMDEYMKVVSLLKAGRTKPDIEKELGRRPGYVNNVIFKLRKMGITP